MALILFSISCDSQERQKSDKIIGGPCEDCDAIFDYIALNKTLNSIDTLQGFEKKSPKLKITGLVLKSDGITPAENVILYVYHTNQKGIYEPNTNANGWEQRHGKYRSWMKTDKDGKYTFYTFRPAAYPNGREAEHIHLYIKEPDKNVYYVDNYVFSDDPMLKEDEKNKLKNRGGSGIVTFEKNGGILTANRDIILGLNIPNY